jgi:predicted dehydrogenase
LRAVQLRPVTRGTEPGVGVIGAGNFAKGVLLPALAARKDLRLCGICAKSGASAQESGRKYDFGYATTDHRRIVSDQDVDAVVIATRHGSHAALVRDALQAGKHVFVEKPLAITEAQLDELEAVYRRMGRSPTGRDDEVEDSSAALPALMVGFNRRFSPHAEAVREAFAERATPMIITYRINAGKIPMDSWIQDSEEGGGRIVGEVCHFIDLCEALTGSPVERVTADSIACQDDRVQTDDTVVITLRHHDGSLSTIQYIAIGNSDVPKEAIEVFADGGVAQIDDFRETRFTGVDRVNVKGRQAKGFEEEFEAFFSAIKAGGVPPIPVESLFRVTRVTFAVLRSLHSGESVEIDHPASD